MSTPVLTAQPLGHAASNCGEVWGIFCAAAAQCATALKAPTHYQGKAMPSGLGHALNSLTTAADKGMPATMRWAWQCCPAGVGIKHLRRGGLVQNLPLGLFVDHPFLDEVQVKTHSPDAMRINPTQFGPQQGFGNVSRWLRGHAHKDKKRMDKIFNVLRLHQGVIAHWRRIFLESITFCHWHKSVAFA